MIKTDILFYIVVKISHGACPEAITVMNNALPLDNR